MKLDKIIECQMENLQPVTRYDPQWRPVGNNQQEDYSIFELMCIKRKKVKLNLFISKKYEKIVISFIFNISTT
jgi:hypothetical protein